jgi:alpha-tubulin suppressor-like RCC1 family protein
LLKAKAIAASIGVGQDPGGVFGGFHTVALDTTGFDWGWGNNDNGQVSPNISGGQSFAVPGVILSPPTIFPTKIAAGAYHTCMSSRIDGVFCRGHNGNGESGAFPLFALPMTTGAVDLAAGGYHTCAVVSGITMDPAGSVVCWGENSNGQVTGMPSSDVHFPTLLTAP